MDKDQLFQKILYFISALHQMEDSLLSSGTGSDITDTQANLMTILYLSGSRNLSSLSSCLHINLPNCSREVKKLTQKGYIRKESSPRDRRIIEISLSSEGRTFMELTFSALKNTFFKNTGDWNVSRLERVYSAIQVLEQDLLPSET